MNRTVLREPDKKRFLDAVNHIESPEIPLFELEADISIVNQMMDNQYDMSLHSFEIPSADLVEWNRRMGNDMVYFGHVWHLGRKEKKDEEGRVHYIDGTMKTPESLKDIWFPDMDVIRRRLEELIKEMEGTGFGLVCGTQTAGFTVPTAIGYETFCLQTIMDPDFISDFQKRVHEYAMKELEMFMDYPIDAFKIVSGLITNTGSMISPDMMEIYEYPFMRDLTKFLKDNDQRILFHIDGRVLDLVPRFLDMGADILNPIQPCGDGQDIYHIKEQYGDQITISGNIDIDGVLLNGTPEEVAADVHEHIEKLSGGGGYIVASSHDIHQLILVENVYAMRDAVHSYTPSAQG